MRGQRRTFSANSQVTMQMSACTTSKPTSPPSSPTRSSSLSTSSSARLEKASDACLRAALDRVDCGLGSALVGCRVRMARKASASGPGANGAVADDDDELEEAVDVVKGDVGSERYSTSVLVGTELGDGRMGRYA